MNERLWSPQMRKWARDAHRHGMDIALTRSRAAASGGGLGVLPLLGDAYVTEDLTTFYGQSVNVYYVPQTGAAATTASFGGAFPYNSNYPTHYINADTWLSTWADDNKIYTMSADSVAGWDGATPSGWNMAISTLSGFDSSVRGTLVNSLVSSFGQATQLGSDGASYKPTGIISVSGVLYVWATRQLYGNAGSGFLQTAIAAQLIKSSDHGVTWTPLPPAQAQPYASPMFTTNFLAPTFIQYGQDYAGNTVDNSNVYVYAIASTNWNNGTNLFLGRVRISAIGNLNAADWSFWTGGDGTLDANWTANVAAAVPILISVNRLSATAVQYFAGVGYLMFEWYYPALPGARQTVNDARWTTYLAPQPWGPWTLIGTNEWVPQGYYNPAVIPKSVSGNTAVVAFTGDFNTSTNPTGLYQLFLASLTLNAPAAATATLDPVNIGNLDTLSGGNLTVTQNDPSNIYYVSARSTHSNNSGKFYCEFVYVSQDFSPEYQGIGICNASFALTGTNDAGGLGLGRDFNSIGFYDDGRVVINNATAHTIQTFGQSAILQMAVDITNKLIWFNVDNGNWNNSGAANPVTGAGGFSLSALNAGPYFAGIAQWASIIGLNVMTANFGAFGGYAYAPPNGYSNW